MSSPSTRKFVRVLSFLMVLALAGGQAFAMGGKEAAPAQGGASSSELSGVLTIFHAGSLTLPLEKMEEEFEALHPGLDIQREASGSTAATRKITDLGKPCDLMISADYQVIDTMLMPEHTDMNIRFANNQLVLCYTKDSRFADEVSESNWYEILQRKGVVWGHSDPNLDPCGYRSLMTLQLAEIYYADKGLYERLLANRPIENVRSKSVDLISLLQSGNMDYAWEYLSVAKQHGLKFIVLPNEINLGDYRYETYYAQSSVQVTGSEPGVMVTNTGSSITYGVALINSAPNRDAAIAFLAYLLSPDKGLRILEDMSQPAIVPARVPTQDMYAKMPDELKPLLEVK
ncbi:MAG: tungstate ABC transporter substrate-binding protein WtpA [Spirochaetales bacterium]|nr:tungstate ABC transporter substrate-binding protein WtpA [Spirochaetales bacterium]